DKGVKRSRDGLVFASLSPEAVDTILLQRGEQEILLKKMEQGAWVVDSLQGFEAQQDKVADLMLKLTTLRFGDQIASGPQHFKHYALADQEALIVRLRKGASVLGGILLGKE